MPDSSQDKTEQATPKKKQDQRKEGNVLQSKEVVIAVTMMATFYGFRLLYGLTESTMRSVFADAFVRIRTMETFTASDAQNMLIQGALRFIIACGPILLIAGLAGILATVAQTRGLVSFKSIKPKFSKLNPLEGIRRMFSLKGFVELLKSVAKIILLIYIIYSVIKGEINTFPKMMDMDLNSLVTTTGQLMFQIINRVVIAFVFLSAADLLYQKWQYDKNMRMTKQEVKEEYKNTEGDPVIKGKIKSRQQEMARRRMMQNVPDANVIIRNPTHYAVALQYDPEKHAAPVVVAKGRDSLALRIVAVAEKHNVTILENKPLARALYAEVELDHEIPKDFYNTVAEVLAFVYSLKKKDLD